MELRRIAIPAVILSLVLTATVVGSPSIPNSPSPVQTQSQSPSHSEEFPKHSGTMNSVRALLDAHILITALLFFLNLALTYIIIERNFISRLRYVGHEMVFLSIGIVTAHLIIGNPVIVLLATIVYIVVWVFTLILTSQVLDRDDRLHPQMSFSLVIGIFSVYFSAAGTVEQHLLAWLPQLSR